MLSCCWEVPLYHDFSLIGTTASCFAKIFCETLWLTVSAGSCGLRPGGFYRWHQALDIQFRENWRFCVHSSLYIFSFQISGGYVELNCTESYMGVISVHFTAKMAGEIYLVYLFLTPFVIHLCVLQLLQYFTVTCA